MGHRYFVEPPIASDTVILRDSESHHLQHVMRAVVGDEVVLFDGSGIEFSARIERIKRAQVELSITDQCTVNRETSRRITVGVAMPKGDRQRWLIEKLTELGVTQVVPLRTEHSVVHPDDRNLKKLRRSVIEASKQCGRNQLMDIAPLQGLPDYLATAPHSVPRWIADPSGMPLPIERSPSDVVFLAIGPEGGFSPHELAAAVSAGWTAVTLGSRILRIETACIALAAAHTC